VEFLGVIIGEDRVRMEKEKVQEVIEWPVSKSVKDVQKFLKLANYYSVKIKGSGLSFFSFLFLFLFSFLFIFPLFYF